MMSTHRHRNSRDLSTKIHFAHRIDAREEEQINWKSLIKEKYHQVCMKCVCGCCDVGIIQLIILLCLLAHPPLTLINPIILLT
jgi:hypothetical protein